MAMKYFVVWLWKVDFFGKVLITKVLELKLDALQSNLIQAEDDPRSSNESPQPDVGGGEGGRGRGERVLASCCPKYWREHGC